MLNNSRHARALKTAAYSSDAVGLAPTSYLISPSVSKKDVSVPHRCDSPGSAICVKGRRTDRQTDNPVTELTSHGCHAFDNSVNSVCPAPPRRAIQPFTAFTRYWSRT
ncbi:hypothetical protein J6590_015116 [Homalodisca vitripennis]|nr:hypothetical protein J6590_015116 [Homalodisca vitripennis]